MRTIDWFRDHGMKEIPERGILSATVPGALHGWVSALERYGSLTLGEVFEDAIHHAEQGFPVTEVIAGEWKHSEPILLSTRSGSETYLLNGRAPRPGQRFVNRDLARTYKTIVREGVKAFYEGEICDAIIDFSNRNQGLFSRCDFKDHATTWVEPVSTDTGGSPSMNSLRMARASRPWKSSISWKGTRSARMEQNGPEYLHLLIEAKKAAFNDRDRYITDPEFADVPVGQLLSKAYAGKIRERIQRDLASPSLCAFTPSGRI